MTCTSCGAENRAGAKFCVECGGALSAVCPSCGARTDAGQKYCAECGTRLGPPSPSVSRVLPADNGSAPRATERRLVTILFADLVGFTTLAEGRDPEAVRELLGSYFEQAQEVIRRYGGTIEKYIGDAVMAVWGTPVAHEDDAERAVRAGLELVDAVRGLRLDLRTDALHSRVGILTGEAAVDPNARDQAMVAGDLVNTASRLQSVAPPDTVLVGEATMMAASRAVTFEPAGEATLKGKAAPVAAWKAMRIVAQTGGVGRVEGLEPPFVGRETEFRLLRHLLHQSARERRAHLVSLTGQAGIGKSRLAWELRKYIDGLVDPVFWHQGRSPSYGTGIAFWALGEMVRKRAGLAETDDEPTTRARIAAMLPEYVADVEERAAIEPCLLALLGVADPPPGGRDRLFAGWRLLFERIADQGAVVLVFEDLHWADDGQLDFIEHLMEWSRSHPIFVVTLARPEILDRRPTWGIAQRNGSALALSPLDDDDMRALLAGLVPGLPDRTVRSILARADGVPLYAVETIRKLVGDGRLVATDGGQFAPAGPLDEIEIPSSLHALIAARLDSLTLDDRALIGDAAVLGKTFMPAALAAVAGLDLDDLERRLRVLAGRELLELDTDPRSPERGQYGFVQSLIREVAYGTLGRRDRRAKHLAAARYFESLGDEELAGALATHYLAAWEAAPEGEEGAAVAHQARIALRAAAERDLSVGAPEQAVEHLRSALRITGLAPADEAELLGRAAIAAEQAGRYAEAEELWSRAVDIRREGPDPDALGAALTGHARALWAANRNEEAIEAIDAALRELDGRIGDLSRARLLALIARLQMRVVRPHDALAATEQLLPIAERERAVDLLVDGLGTRAGVLNQLGRPWEATALLSGLIAAAHGEQMIADELRLMGLQVIIDIDDHPRRAVETGRAAFETARRLGLRTQLVYSVLNAGEAAIRTGDWTWARAALGEVIDRDIEPGDLILVGTTALAIDLLMGQDPSSLHARLDAVEGIGESIRANMQVDYRLWEAYVSGDHETVLRVAPEAARADPLNAPALFERAIRAAVWLGDAQGASALLVELRSLGRRGELVDAVELGLAAAIDGLSGRIDEAARGLRDAVARMRGLEAAFGEAQVALDAVRVLGADSRVGAEMAAVARPILERLGATPLLEQLDRLVGDSAATVDARSATRAGLAGAGTDGRA